MGKAILVTGGARSGKSRFAENLAKKLGSNIIYVATSIPFDEEMKMRVKKHREQRPPYWETVEAYKDMDVHLEGKTGDNRVILVDCITIMVTNIMLEKNLDWENLNTDEMTAVEDDVRREIDKLIGIAGKSVAPVIFVTNEVGMGVVPDNVLTRMFRDIAGRANQMLAAVAAEVYLCVSGIPVKIK